MNRGDEYDSSACPEPVHPAGSDAVIFCLSQLIFCQRSIIPELQP
jgi:hypothetical protein